MGVFHAPVNELLWQSFILCFLQNAYIYVSLGGVYLHINIRVLNAAIESVTSVQSTAVL